MAPIPQIDHLGSYYPLLLWLLFRKSTISAAITRYFYGSYSANRPSRQLLPATFMAPIPQIDHLGSYYPLLLRLLFRKSTISAAITRYFYGSYSAIKLGWGSFEVDNFY